MISDIQRAEQKSRARAVTMGLLALVLLGNATFGIFEPINDSATRGITWLVTIALALTVLSTSGGLLLNPRLRALMNDERSRQNRARAFAAAFFAAMLVAAALYVASWWEPIETRGALRLLTGWSLAAGLGRYALLEAL